MTIIVGTATVNASTGKVELTAPLGFATARGVRLSNFTGDTLILTNISGTEQSQEYLAPQTQMVYSSINAGTTPVVVGYAYPASQIAANLLVEWSTDPDNDFIGTYPCALPASGISAVDGSNQLTTVTLNSSTASHNLGVLPSEFIVLKLSVPGVAGNGFACPIRVRNGATDVWVLWSALTGSASTIYIPVRLSNIDADTTFYIYNSTFTSSFAGTLTVYSANQPLEYLPYQYTDICPAGGIEYQTTTGLTPASSSAQMKPSGAFDTTTYGVSWLNYLGDCDVSIGAQMNNSAPSPFPDIVLTGISSGALYAKPIAGVFKSTDAIGPVQQSTVYFWAWEPTRRSMGNMATYHGGPQLFVQLVGYTTDYSIDVVARVRQVRPPYCSFDQNSGN